MLELLNLPILVAEGGGLDLFDVKGAGNLIWTLIIFAISIPLMWKMVFGPISAALQERDDHQARAIAAAEKASSEAEKARAAVEIKLGEAQAEAQALLATARERAEASEQKILAEAKDQAKSELENAKKAIRAEQDKALATIRTEVVELSMNAASQVLERQVSGDGDRRLVESIIEKGGVSN